MARNPEPARLDQAAAAVRERGAALLAISGDNPIVHTASAKKHGFAFPLLSDVHRPTGHPRLRRPRRRAHRPSRST